MQRCYRFNFKSIVDDGILTISSYNRAQHIGFKQAVRSIETNIGNMPTTKTGNGTDVLPCDQNRHDVAV